MLEVGLTSYERWTDEEDQFLRENWKTMSIKDVASQLGRSAGAVRSRFRHLELESSKGAYSREAGHPPSAAKRDYFKEGYDFEVYVANTLFPRPGYEIEYFTT